MTSSRYHNSKHFTSNQPSGPGHQRHAGFHTRWLAKLTYWWQATRGGMVRFSRHPVRLHYLLYYLFLSPCSKIMGNRGVKPKPKAPATRLPAKGKPGQPRRTPQHIADPAGLCDTYDVEDIIAERMAKNHKGNSEKQWLVQWRGFPASAQTWEPPENFSGCEAFIARFNEEREANERADPEKGKRTRDAQEEKRQKKQKSESGTGALLDSATSAPLQAQTGRRTSVV